MNSLRTLLCLLCLAALPACTITPAGKQASADAVLISKSAAVAAKATQDAKDGNSTARARTASAQSLDAQIDAKDRVIEQYFRQHEISR